MNGKGAIPSASSLLWGLALLFLATPACVGLGISTPSDFFLMLGVVLGLIGVFALANGVWAFLTTFDRMAERYLGPATPGGTDTAGATADATADAPQATPAREE